MWYSGIWEIIIANTIKGFIIGFKEFREKAWILLNWKREGHWTVNLSLSSSILYNELAWKHKWRLINNCGLELRNYSEDAQHTGTNENSWWNNEASIIRDEKIWSSSQIYLIISFIL
jgi:hypothetical protein